MCVQQHSLLLAYLALFLVRFLFPPDNMWRGGAYFAVAQKDCLRFESGGGGDVFFLLKYKQRCRVDFEFPMYKSTKMKDFNFKGVWVVRYNKNLV